MNVTKLTIGCSRAGSLGNPTPVSEVGKMWQTAVDAGIRSFDTANIYAQGDSERHLGRMLRANPGLGIEVVTKAGFWHGWKADLVRLLKPALRPLLHLTGASDSITHVRTNIDNQDFDTSYLSACVDESLKRLGIEAVSGFLLHEPSDEVLAMREICDFLARLKDEGRARLVGVSLGDRESTRAVLDMGSVDILQMPVTTYETIRGTGIEDEIKGRGIRLYLRQIINRPDRKPVALEQALAELTAEPAVHSVIVGVSKLRNLETILALAAR